MIFLYTCLRVFFRLFSFTKISNILKLLYLPLSEADGCGGVTEMDDGAGNTKWYIRHGLQFMPNSVVDPVWQRTGNSVSYLKPGCPCYRM